MDDVYITPNPPTIKEDVVKMLNNDPDMIISKEDGVNAITDILRTNTGSKRIVYKRVMSQQTANNANANYKRIVDNSKVIDPYTLTHILRDLKKDEIKDEDKINIYNEILEMEKLIKTNKNKQQRLITNENYKALYDLLYEILNLNMNRIKYGKEVCENRREEGYFINSSLKLIRDTINEILIEKGKNVLLQAPDIISDCLEDYCPTLSNCFQLTPVKNENTEYSIIFDDVYKYLRQSVTDYKKIDFYKEILVCVFCVLNISRKANDPPLVSYLDMNELKKTYYYIDAPIDTIKENVSKLISKIKYYNSKEEDKHGMVDVIQEDMDKLEKLNDIVTSNSDGQQKSEYKNVLEKVMNQVDNSNAVSAMGTLIFTDKIAKLNTIDTVCQPRLNDDITNSYEPLYGEMNEPIKEVGKEPISPQIHKNRQINNNKSKSRHVRDRAGKRRGTRIGGLLILNK
jgi:endonuclease III